MKKPFEMFDGGIANMALPQASNAGCFLAGTRVWTDKGKVPIEQIKVGDLVLSQSPTQEKLAYKPVVKALVYEEKNIYMLSYIYEDDEGEASDSVYVTGNHRFSVKGLGWIRADELSEWRVLLLANGKEAIVGECEPVYKTDRACVGWVTLQDSYGYEHDFNTNEIKNRVPANLEIINSADPYLKIRVYNLEVDDFHTFFVKDAKLWVQDDTRSGSQKTGHVLQLI